MSGGVVFPITLSLSCFFPTSYQFPHLRLLAQAALPCADLIHSLLAPTLPPEMLHNTNLIIVYPLLTTR